MSLYHIFILAVIQGLTEFLPVSSSGHLSLMHGLGTLPDQGVLFDVALHAGTLFAVIFYFRRDVGHMALGGVAILRGRPSEHKQLAWQIGLATLPIIPVGALFMLTGLADQLRSPVVIAWASILFAVPLYLTDRFMRTDKRLDELGYSRAFVIGLAQLAALIPGASRAGVTITAARGMGFNRQEAARFSMLMSIPVIMIFTLLGLIDLLQKGNFELLSDAAFGAVLAAAMGLIGIHFFLKMTARFSLLPFVLYRLALGTVLLTLFSV